MKVQRFAAVVGTALLLSACSTGIKITRVESPAPVQGTPWNLAMTQFGVTITRHVVQCGAEFKGTVEVIATPSAVPDIDQRYVLESNGWWATSDITATLAASGISTGLNAQYSDASAKVISNVVGTVGQLAIRAATGGVSPLVNAPAGGAKAASAAEVCTEETAAAVAALYPAPDGTPGLKAMVDARIAAVAASTAKVALLTRQAVLDKRLKPDLVAALGEQHKLQQELATAQKSLQDAINKTTHTQTLRWPLRADVFRTQTPMTLDPAMLQKWLRPGVSAIREDAQQQFAVHLALFRPDATAATWQSPAQPTTVTAPYGVPVRLAQTGRLLACVNGDCPTALDAFASQDKRFIQFEQVVLQMGQMYVVPLTGGSFRSQAAVIAMDANGLPTSIQIAERVAAAEGLSGAAKDVATQLAALPGQVSAAKLAATTAQTSQINAEAALAAAQLSTTTNGQTAPLVAQTALLNAQNALAQARAAAGVQQTLEISAQTAMLNAQAALITAQANATTGPAVGALTAQTTLINAQATQINASAALAKAQAAAATLP